MVLDDRKYMDPKEYRRLLSKKPKPKVETEPKENETEPIVKKPWWKVW